MKEINIMVAAALLFCINLSGNASELPTLGADAGYTLKTPSEEQNRTITVYEVNSETGQAVPKQYELNLKKTEYGNGDLTKTFEWSDEENKTFSETGPTEGKTSITVKYDSDYLKTTPQTNTSDQETVSDNFSLESGSPAYTNDTSGSIQNLSGIFFGNKSTYNREGALFNKGSIENINSAFIGNSITGNRATEAVGAAITNKGSIGSIVADFIGNNINASVNGQTSYGGAIYNDTEKTIDSIIGSFIGNYIKSNNIIYGGAISNKGTITDIESDFIANYINATYNNAFGGAISNNGTITNLKGDFIGNYIYSSSSNRQTEGGAIYNAGSSQIDNIESNFIANHVEASTSAKGGAISNHGTLTSVKGDFTDNYVKSGKVYGGAIYNDNEISEVQGNFVNNYAEATYNEAYGGAIYNDTNGNITTITGNFAGNNVQNNSTNNLYRTSGGAIFNKGTIGTLSANFYENYSKVTNNSNQISMYGGAIYNEKNITEITGNFEKNYAYSENSHRETTANGGAIYNATGALIGSINSNFTANNAQSGRDAKGGAIYNEGNITSITGKFEDNTAQGPNQGFGGAIYNKGTLTLTNSSFTNNYATTDGGAIYTESDLTIEAKDGFLSQFSGNHTNSSSNAIYVSSGSANLNLKDTTGGIIQFDDEIDGTEGYKINIEGDMSSKIIFNNNIKNADITLKNTVLNVKETDGTSDILKSSKLTFDSGMLDVKDGKITNYNIKSVSGEGNVGLDLLLNSDECKGDTFTLSESGNGKINISSVNISGDVEGGEYKIQIIKSPDGNTQLEIVATVQDEATANMDNHTIIADGFSLATTDTTNDSILVSNLRDSLSEWAKLDSTEDKTFSFLDSSNYILSEDSELNGNNFTITGANNTIDVNGHKFLSEISSTQKVNVSDINFKNMKEIKNSGELTLKNVTAQTSITSDTTGNLNVENNKLVLEKLQNQDITSEQSDIYLTNVAEVNSNSLTMREGSLNIGNLSMNKLKFDALNVTNAKIDIYSTDVDLKNTKMGSINSDNFVADDNSSIVVENLKITSESNADVIAVPFTNKDINVSTPIHNLLAPIYRYNVAYSNDGTYGEDGYFVFSHPSKGKNYENFNPAIVASPVAAQIGGYLTQLNSYNEAFRNMDMYMLLTKDQRNAIKYQNKYAAADSNLVFNPFKVPNAKYSGFLKPYANFERVKLKNGPDVSNVAYGSFFGFDSDIVELNDKWDAVGSIYVGYNGSHQAYEGNSIYQNGGTLGMTGLFYRGNLFTGITANVGANVGQANTMYGNEDFTLLMTGIASKTGYNIELSDGRFIIQPNSMIAYSFVNTFNYTNAAGVNIDTDAINAITLMPGLKFIGNLPKGWQPYLGVNMVWNIMDKANFKANDIALPELSVKPYVMYGLGVRKSFGDRFTGYIQSYITNGGRDGIGLQGGFRWEI